MECDNRFSLPSLYLPTIIIAKHVICWDEESAEAYLHDHEETLISGVQCIRNDDSYGNENATKQNKNSNCSNPSSVLLPPTPPLTKGFRL